MTRASLPTGAVMSTPFPDGCGLRQTSVTGDGGAGRMRAASRRASGGRDTGQGGWAGQATRVTLETPGLSGCLARRHELGSR